MLPAARPARTGDDSCTMHHKLRRDAWPMKPWNPTYRLRPRFHSQLLSSLAGHWAGCDRILPRPSRDTERTKFWQQGEISVDRKKDAEGTFGMYSRFLGPLCTRHMLMWLNVSFDAEGRTNGGDKWWKFLLMK